MRLRVAPSELREGNLVPPGRRASQQQARDIRTGDEQHDADRGQQHDQWTARLARHILVKGRNVHAKAVRRRRQIGDSRAARLVRFARACSTLTVCPSRATMVR